MTSLTLGHPISKNRLGDLWHRITRSDNRPATSDKLPDDTHFRKAFITEMLNKNSEAFQSELDVQSMMHVFPGRF